MRWVVGRWACLLCLPLVGCAGAPPEPQSVEDEASAGAEAAPVEETSEPPVEPPAAEEAADPIEEWLGELRFHVRRPTRWQEPEGATRREGDAVTTWTSADGRRVTERYADGTIVVGWVEGPPAPEGHTPRLFSGLHPGTWPHFVLWPGGETTYLVPMFGGEEGGEVFGQAGGYRIPLRRPPVGGSAELDRAALLATARVRYGECMQEPPEDAPDEVWQAFNESREGEGCFYYGTEAALRAVPTVPGGWYLSEARANPNVPIRWATRGPSEGSREVVVREADIDEATYERLEGDPPGRVELRLGRRYQHAFDLPVDVSSFYANRAIFEHDGALLVVVHLAEAGLLAVSRHHRRTGRRLGPPFVVAVGNSQGDVHGIGYISLFPVLAGDTIATAMGFDGLVGDALLFDQPGRPGRWVRIAAPQAEPSEGGEPEYADTQRLALLRLDRCEDVPCLRVAAQAEAREP